MAFENLVAANRGPGIDHNLLAGIGQRANQSYAQGQQNRLVQEEAARQEEFRNILAEYVGPEQAAGAEGGGQNRLSPAGPEPLPGEAINRLMAVDPERATELVSAQQQQQDVARQRMQERAGEAVRRMQLVLDSETPAETLRHAGRMSDGSDLMERLAQEGVINAEDGVSDDEAVRLAEHAIATYGPMLEQGEGDRTSAAIGDMQALGYPMTREGFAQYNEDKGDGSAAGLEALIEEARLRGILMEQEQTQRASEEAETEAAREATDRENTLKRSLDQTEKIADITSQLEGSLLEPGVPFSDIRRAVASGGAAVGRLFGADVQNIDDQVEQFDTLRKNLRSQLIAAADSGQFDQVTNAKLSLYQESLANEDISPGAIRSIQADLAETFLEQADSYEIAIPERGKYERLIKRLRGDFEAMTLEELNSLDRSNMSDEELAAAEQRWEALQAAGGE